MSSSAVHTAARSSGRPRLWLRFLYALVLSQLLASRAAWATELEEDHADLAAQLHLKILSYDRSLKARTSGKLTLAILYRPDREESERVRGLMQNAFREQAAKSTVQGMSLSVTAVAIDAKTLAKRLSELGVTVIYVTPGLEDVVTAVSAAAQSLKAATLCGRRSLLDAGMALAVVSREDRPGIIVNLPVAKALGLDLDPSLLRLAEVKR